MKTVRYNGRPDRKGRQQDVIIGTGYEEYGGLWSEGDERELTDEQAEMFVNTTPNGWFSVVKKESKKSPDKESKKAEEPAAKPDKE